MLSLRPLLTHSPRSAHLLWQAAKLVPVDVTEILDTPYPAATVYDTVANLDTYPEWLDIVVGVEPDGHDAWLVELRARIGLLARSKRLRMKQTIADGKTTVRYERVEIDRRAHAPWTLDVSVRGTGEKSSTLRMHLHYGGRLWGPMLEPVLSAEITKSRDRLIRYLNR